MGGRFRCRLFPGEGEQIIINVSDPAGKLCIVAEQRLRLLPGFDISRAPGKRAQLPLVRGQGLALEVVKDLNAVLNGAKKYVSTGEVGMFLVGDQSLLGEQVQGLECVLFRNVPVAPRIDS